MSWGHDTPTQQEIERARLARLAEAPQTDPAPPLDDEGDGLVLATLCIAGALGFLFGLLFGWCLA